MLLATSLSDGFQDSVGSLLGNRNGGSIKTSFTGSTGADFVKPLDPTQESLDNLSVVFEPRKFGVESDFLYRDSGTAMLHSGSSVVSPELPKKSVTAFDKFKNKTIYTVLPLEPGADDDSVILRKHCGFFDDFLYNHKNGANIHNDETASMNPDLAGNKVHTEDQRVDDDGWRQHKIDASNSIVELLGTKFLAPGEGKCAPLPGESVCAMARVRLLARIRNRRPTAPASVIDLHHKVDGKSVTTEIYSDVGQHQVAYPICDKMMLDQNRPCLEPIMRDSDARNGGKPIIGWLSFRRKPIVIDGKYAIKNQFDLRRTHKYDMAKALAHWRRNKAHLLEQNQKQKEQQALQFAIQAKEKQQIELKAAMAAEMAKPVEEQDPKLLEQLEDAGKKAKKAVKAKVDEKVGQAKMLAALASGKSLTEANAAANPEASWFDVLGEEEKGMSLDTSADGKGPPMMVYFPLGEPIKGHWNSMEPETKTQDPGWSQLNPLEADSSRKIKDFAHGSRLLTSHGAHQGANWIYSNPHKKTSLDIDEPGLGKYKIHKQYDLLKEE